MTTTEKTDPLISDPEILFRQMEAWRAKGWHILTPATRVERFAPNWVASVSFVTMDPNVNDAGRGTDVYYDPSNMKPDERGISRIGLDRIARCAGISWDPTFSVRVDDRRMMHLWEYRAVGVGLDFDGSPFTITGTREVDLRDGSAQIGGWTPQLWQDACDAAHRERKPVKSINGWTDRRVLASRSHGLQLCETKAKDRAVRSLGLSHVYTVKQLQNPFVVIKATYQPDMSDAEVRSMVAEQSMRGTRALFAPHVGRSTIHTIDITPAPLALPPALPAETVDADIERLQQREVQEQRQQASEPIETKAVAKADPPREEPVKPVEATKPDESSEERRVFEQPGQLEEGWRRDADVLEVKELKSGTGARGSWALVQITLGFGGSTEPQSHRTLNAEITDAARQAKANGTRVDVRVEKDGKYLNIAEIEPATYDDDEDDDSSSELHA